MSSIWTKVVIASSLDGRIAIQGSENKSLGSVGDRKVLEDALTWADAALLGGNTLRIIQSTCLIKNNELIEKRIKNGQSPQPISIVISKEENINYDTFYFNQSVERWLINTSEKHCKINPNNGFTKELNFEQNWSNTLKVIGSLGISRLVILGGSQVISSLILEDLINELQITLVPKIISGEHNWITSILKNKNRFIESTWNLNESRLMPNNELLLRYLRSYS